MPAYTDPAARFHSRYVVAANGCWIWQGALLHNGYGELSVRCHKVRAHRFSYELLIGPIPDGLTLDHLCRNRACVNPAHLEPVTMAENVKRGESPPARNARKDECVNGHPFTPENTYRHPNGGRHCRICRRADGQAFHDRNRERRNARRRKVSVASAVLAFAFFAFYGLPRGIDYELAQAAPATTVAERTVQGKGVVWWSKRAVQARRDANARGQTIKRLKRQLRGGVLPWYWLAVGSCESGLRWRYNGSSGYDGALQFHPGTWSANRLSFYPPFAYLASPFQQLVVAEIVLARQGWGAWPHCSRKVGLR